jgi:2-polyprenyl-6-hydroxyphenyl methylase/3-demethylubiquinone-9 3-methyltransferase
MGSHDENLDPAEISKFDLMASRWWDPNSEFKPLHDINPLRLQWIAQGCAGLADKRTLDVGCGGGILSESLAAAGARVTGIDMGKGALQTARLHLLESGLTVQYEQIAVERMAEQHPQAFDLITCMEMLEHVPDPASVIRACATLAKPGAHLFFSTINRNPKAYALAIIGAEYLLRMLPAGTHDYDKFITPAELGHWIREAGLELASISGVTYNPLGKSYHLNARDVSVNYMVHCRRPLD